MPVGTAAKPPLVSYPRCLRYADKRIAAAAINKTVNTIFVLLLIIKTPRTLVFFFPLARFKRYET
jgi:hypothetical protein